MSCVFSVLDGMIVPFLFICLVLLQFINYYLICLIVASESMSPGQMDMCGPRQRVDFSQVPSPKVVSPLPNPHVTPPSSSDLREISCGKL